MRSLVVLCCFFFNVTATTEIYTYLHTLSLHDALPICSELVGCLRVELCLLVGDEGGDARPGAGQHADHQPQQAGPGGQPPVAQGPEDLPEGDRKSTRLNSSH